MKSKRRSKFAIYFGMLFLLPACLSAQEYDPNPLFWADTVTVVGLRSLSIPTVSSLATKSLMSLHSTPASIGVVTRPLFENQNAIVLSDALKNISGVNVQNGFGTFDFFFIRGFESLSSGLVLTDGAAEPEVSFYNLYNIERVEVLKGPAAFLYGSNPLSGAVNLVRKQPVFKNFANVSASYGEFKTTRGMFDAGLANESKSLAFRLNGIWQESDGFRDNKDNKNFAINPAFTWRIDDLSAVTVNFEYVKSDYAPDSGLPLQFNLTPQFTFVPAIPDVSRERSYQTPLDDSDQELLRGRMDYQRELSEIVTLRNKFYFTKLDWLTNGTLLNGAFPNQVGGFSVFRTLQALDDKQNLFGNQLEAVFKFNTGAVSNSLVAGVEASRLSDDFNLGIASPSPQQGINNALIVDLLNPVEAVTDIGQLTVFPFAVGDSRSLVLAPYFVNQASFSEKLQLVFGGRFDVIDYDDDRADLNFATGQVVPSTTQRNYQKFSPMVGLTFAPNSALSLYANAGQAFAPPSSLTQGDPKPEESTQFEVGAKVRTFNGRLQGGAALYHLQKENIGIPDATGITQQTGDQRARGVEFDLSVQPVNSWHAFLTYAYTDAELTEFRETVQDPTGQQPFLILDHGGNSPIFAPKHILNFWTTKEYRVGVGFGAGFRYVSSQFIDEDNEFEVDSALTFDASLYYTYRNWRWSVNVRNITDAEYETRGFGSTSVTPANPRAVYGAIDFSL
jgi:iron complex outermembrane receptor protein